MQQLTNLAVIENSVIALQFNLMWSQEDIPSLSQHVITRLPKVVCIQHVEGADRQSYQLNIGDNNYWLHFECYSQSCWFEGFDATANKNIEWLASSLRQRLGE